MKSVLRHGLCATVVLAAIILLAARVTLAAPVAPVEKNAATASAGRVVAAGPGEAKPAEEGNNAGKLTAIEVVPLAFTIAIFVVLVLVLRFTAWKPILQGLKAREESIRNSIEAAAKAKADAERTTRDLQAKMEEVQRQAAVQLQQAKADAQKLAEGIKTQAEAEAGALKDRTLRDIEAAKTQAVTEINAHAAELGVAVARKILQRNITVEDHARLVDESLAALGTSKV